MTALEAVCAVLDALDAAHAPSMLRGSFASDSSGVARATKDADGVVDIERGKLPSILANLDPRIAMQAQMMFETMTRTTRPILQVENSPFQIELLHVNSDPFMTGRFQRQDDVDSPELGRSNPDIDPKRRNELADELGIKEFIS